MAEKDYYQTLGVSRTASADELKKAYRKLAMQHHPDRNPGDAEAEKKFKELNEAYEILKDPEKRKMYDQFGAAAFQGGRGPGGGAGASGFDFNSGFSDIFDDLFGAFGGGAGRGRSGGARNNRGSDVRYNLEITLEDAFTGKQQSIRVGTAVTCETCDGSGSKDKDAKTTCGTCHGTGKLRMQQGFFTIERTCATCQGTGQIIKNPCGTCHGAGRVNKQRTLSVNIPAGVEDGTRIRLSGEGEAGLHGGAPGDLYIFISVLPHEFFTRDGMDIHCQVPVKMADALLGGAVEVPTLDGKRAKVKVPEGTQTTHQFRLKGKGMPSMRGGGNGDLYIHAFVEIPKKLSAKQRELIEQFNALSNDSDSPETANYLKNVLGG